MADTTNYKFNIPVVGGDQNNWGGFLNENWSKIDSLLYGVSYTDADANTVSTIQPDLAQGSWKINSTTVTASATSINKLTTFSGTTADLNILSGASSAGVTSTELQALDGVTSNIQTQINNITGGSSTTIPSGLIAMWSGFLSAIPTGWVLCDGTNSTPDLSGRFVKGVGSSGMGVGSTGGAASVTLSEANIPQHSHSFSGTTDSQTTTYDDITATGSYFDGADGGTDRGLSADAPAAAHTHTFSGTTGTYGHVGPVSFTTEPPYYALAFIMKT